MWSALSTGVAEGSGAGQYRKDVLPDPRRVTHVNSLIKRACELLHESGISRADTFVRFLLVA